MTPERITGADVHNALLRGDGAAEADRAALLAGAECLEMNGHHAEADRMREVARTEARLEPHELTEKQEAFELLGDVLLPNQGPRP